MPKEAPKKVVRFANDYHLNGEVLYQAGVAVPHTEHTAQLLADGVEGEVSDAPVEGKAAA